MGTAIDRLLYYVMLTKILCPRNIDNNYNFEQYNSHIRNTLLN